MLCDKNVFKFVEWVFITSRTENFYYNFSVEPMPKFTYQDVILIEHTTIVLEIILLVIIN